MRVKQMHRPSLATVLIAEFISIAHNFHHSSERPEVFIAWRRNRPPPPKVASRIRPSELVWSFARNSQAEELAAHGHCFPPTMPAAWRNNSSTGTGSHRLNTSS